MSVSSPRIAVAYAVRQRMTRPAPRPRHGTLAFDYDQLLLSLRGR